VAAPSKVQALVKEGDKLYKENKYVEAAETLKKAYAIEPSPVLLYNIARAYDQRASCRSRSTTTASTPRKRPPTPS